MGKVAVVGGKVGMEAPSTEIMASDIAVGSSVYLMENGSPVEYLVVNQGIPSNSSLAARQAEAVTMARPRRSLPLRPTSLLRSRPV